MNSREAVEFLKALIRPGSINNVQEIVFHQAWEGQTYSRIADFSGYDENYIKEVGSLLWKLLSKKLKEKVNKSNFRAVLKSVARQIQVANFEDFEDINLYRNEFKRTFSIISRPKTIDYLSELQKSTKKKSIEEEYVLPQFVNSFEKIQFPEYLSEEFMKDLFQLKARIDQFLDTLKKSKHNVQKTAEVERQVIEELYNWSSLNMEKISLSLKTKI